MLAYILALAVGLGSFIIYMAAFFFPEVHRKGDFIWSGIGLFYALVLWFCAGRITGAVLLGQTASVALLGWFGWQTLTLRRQLTPKELQTAVATDEAITEKSTGILSKFTGKLTGLVKKSPAKTKEKTQDVTQPVTPPETVTNLQPETTSTAAIETTTPVDNAAEVKQPEVKEIVNTPVETAATIPASTIPAITPPIEKVETVTEIKADIPEVKEVQDVQEVQEVQEAIADSITTPTDDFGLEDDTEFSEKTPPAPIPTKDKLSTPKKPIDTKKILAPLTGVFAGIQGLIRGKKDKNKVEEIKPKPPETVVTDKPQSEAVIPTPELTPDEETVLEEETNLLESEGETTDITIKPIENLEKEQLITPLETAPVQEIIEEIITDETISASITNTTETTGVIIEEITIEVVDVTSETITETTETTTSLQNTYNSGIELGEEVGEKTPELTAEIIETETTIATGVAEDSIKEPAPEAITENASSTPENPPQLIRPKKPDIALVEAARQSTEALSMPKPTDDILPPSPEDK